MIRKLPYCVWLSLILLIFASCPTTSMPEVARLPSFYVRVYPAPENGSIKLSEHYVTSGNWITVYVNPDPGYTLKPESLKSFNEDAKDLSGTTLRFIGTRFQTQIGSNRRITAEFETVSSSPSGAYSIHIDSGLENGFIIANPLSAPAGTQITLILEPDPGFDLKAGTLTVNSTVLSDAPPYTFTMPSENVAVRAVFETKDFTQLKQSAWNYLNAKQYDTAAGFFEEAWKNNPQDPTSIFYSSIAKVAKLLIDPDVRKIISSFHFKTPGTLDDWICDGYSESEQWWYTYSGTYSIGPYNYEGRDIALPEISPAHWNFVTPYSDFAISQAPKHIQTYKNHTFWGLISSYSGGFNPLIENLLRDFFANDYEEAISRAASFPSNEKVELHPGLKARFGLEEYYGAGTTYVGKAELDYIFGFLRMFKAAVEYLSAYNLTMEMRNLLITEIVPLDGLDNVLQKMFLLTDPMSGARRDLWQDYPTVIRMLPFRNNFLRVRNEKQMSKAKTNFTIALEMLDASLSHWYGISGNGSGTSQWSGASKTKNNWIKNCISEAKTAITGNGVFYFPNKIPDYFDGAKWIWPSPGWDWPVQSTPDTDKIKVYGLNVEKFFTPGTFTLQNIFATEMGGEAPQLWRIEWYEDRANEYETVYTGNNTLVTEPIVNRGRQNNVVGNNNAPFGKYSFMLNTKYLKEVFPRGFDTYKSMADGSVKNSADQQLLCEIFPTIPMWPWAPSYFGNTITATDLYYWYHLR